MAAGEAGARVWAVCLIKPDKMPQVFRSEFNETAPQPELIKSFPGTPKISEEVRAQKHKSSSSKTCPSAAAQASPPEVREMRA